MSHSKPVKAATGARTALSTTSPNISHPSKPAAGQKRKSKDAALSPDDIDCEGMVIDSSCNVVRGKIRRFLDAGEMKVGEFCDAIGVSNKSLNAFRGQSGKMKGSESNTYFGAWEFFKKRELAGIKMPTKKQKTTAAAAAAGSAAGSEASKSVKQAGNSAGMDISSIHLPHEEQDDVPVFDSCDEVRRKINLHLKKDGVTQAQFCRDLHAQLHAASSSKIQSVQLNAFRNKKGADAGNTSCVYYAAYVFFEKLRLLEGKSKTKHRTDAECIWPGGFERDRIRNHFWCGPGETPSMDEYGRVSFR